MHSLPDWRSLSQASSRAAESTAMVSGSKGRLGPDQIKNAGHPRTPTQKRQAAPLDRGGAFHLLVATIQFAGQI